MKHFVFLICSERSGSNLIASLMNAHSKICGPPPSHLFRLFGTNRGNYGDLGIKRNWDTLVSDVVYSFKNTPGTWNTTVTVQDLTTSVKRASAALLLRAVYEREADQDGASHLFVKENQTYAFAAFLLANFQDCRFVFMVRDPRDVASSWLATQSMPGGVKRAVEVWLNDQEGGLSLYDQLRDSGRILMVRYEDLVQDTVRVLSKLTDFMELSFEDRMLEFYREARTIRNARRIKAWGNLRKPVLSDNTGKFRSTLSETDLLYNGISLQRDHDSFGLRD